ncbi:uncharacterized protein KIAA1522 homolog isoform X2 [Nematolebias whitei]|uniref:uncharacterized protein KIAA1522 homolog isoform X2 n=1 Tax=Nematolebias whitei TaxID=451745 RepID=UPI00189B75ED|nr:uncharacterized protein KIAA1522 homolog isoform X2 [Nematolebias whitei]
MSNRDSLGFGDLLPQDVINVFAQEKNSKRGRKKRTRAFSRAFGWFRKKKRKNLGSNGQSPGLGLTLDGHRAGHPGGHKAGQKSGRQAHAQGNSHAAPKLNDDYKTPAAPQIQENVFMEGSRSKYVEDLHTEAQEGLKMMQEESHIGEKFQDDVSTVSTVTVDTDGEGTGFVTDSTIPDTSSVVSMRSSVSTRSSRSGLTRQGSTFRPLNSGKKSEKSKTRRKQRKNVPGIPRHVQKELGLDRVGWTINEKQVYNGETNVSSTTDGSQHDAGSPKGSGASPQASNFIYPLSKDKVEQLNAAHAGHRDDLALLHRLHPLLTDEQRPRSMAVPWMTTSSSLLQQPPSPVMSMSPQAAYLSKIIPNAVLPPSIDVVEISRGRSRSSVRTVSKSSLLLSSPAPSRASSRASSSRTSSSMFTSASRYNGPNMSDTSCWSNSDSDTLVSDSSTISSSSTSRQKSEHRYTFKENKVNINSSDGTSKVIIKEDQVKKDGQFVRSLSVMKTKRPPPPPNRSNSLHSKVKRRSRDLAEVRIISGEQSTLVPSGENKPGTSPVLYRSINSPDYHADTSSLDESTGSASFTFIKSQLQEPKAEDSKNVAEIIYKEDSYKKQQPLQENKPSKVISPSSGYSSQDGTSPIHKSSPQHKNNTFLTKLHKLFGGSAPSFSAHPGVENVKPTGEPKSDTISVSPSVQTLRELFNIPPPPKVHAPPPPPPEVWAHSKRTFELLLGPPAPDDVYAIIKKNPKDRRHQRQSPSVSTESSVKSLVLERKHKNPVTESKTVQESRIFSAEIHKENNESLAQNGSLKEIYMDEKVRVCDMLNGIFVKAVEQQAIKEGCQKATRQATEVKTFTDPLPSISLGRISPSPSPQLADHPVQRTTTETTEGASVSKVQVTSPESSWPPPPPPMNQGKISRSDETDFPLPPPPLFGEVGLVSLVQVQLKESSLGDDLSSTYVSVKSKLKVEQVTVFTGDEAQKRCSPDKVVSLSTSVPPPPPYTAPPPPTVTIQKVVLPPKEASPPPPVGSITYVVQEVIPRVPSPDKDASPPVNVVEVLTFPPKKTTALSPENASQPAGDTAPESKLAPPQSIPPLPPLPSLLQLSEQLTDPPHKNISLEPETKDLSNSIFITPQSIPPPTEPLLKHSVIIQTTDDPATDDAPPSPPLEFKNPPSLKEAETPAPNPPINIPPPPLLPAQIPASINHQSSRLSTENQTQEKSSASDGHKELSIITPSLLQKVKLRSINSSPEPLEGQEQASVTAVHKEPTSVITHSLLQMVKLRSVNSSPEPSEAAKEETKSTSTSAPLQIVKLQSVNNSPEPPEAAKEETKSTSTSAPLQIVRLQSVNNSPEPSEAQEQPEPEATVNQQTSNRQTSSSNNETPQKPIRKSLIVPSLTSTSEPSQSLVVPPASPSPVASPVKKSHTTTTTSVSMNLQEAIRLRTAARSKEGPASRLSLHSPVSPPSTSPSFVFSKSNPVVGVVTKHKQVNKEIAQTKSEDSSVTKVTSQAESKVGLKMPPPVAKKPKTKSKEVEASEAIEQTAGQEAQHDGIKDVAEEINGTAGTVQEETTSA